MALTDNIEDFRHLVGKLVYKRRSHKPFKSGNKIERVTMLCAHEHLPITAALFEDGSYCEARKLEVVDGQSGLVPGVDY